MKKFICGLIAGVIISGIGAYAVNEIYDNPYPIYVNGESKQIQGYNIDGYSYFKLRDIAQATDKFNVDFQNDNVIIDTTSEYATPANFSTANTINIDYEYLKECAMRIPDFEQLDLLNSDEWIEQYLFYWYTGKVSDLSKTTDDLYYAYNESLVRSEFYENFGIEMPNTLKYYYDGYYWIHVSDFGEVIYTFNNIKQCSDGVDVTFMRENDDTYFGTTTLHLIYASNSIGYIITSKTSENNYQPKTKHLNNESVNGIQD